MEEHKKYKFKRVVAQVSKKYRFALYMGIRVDLRLEWGSWSHGSEPNRSLRVVFGNPSGFNARMGLVIALKVSQVMSKPILNWKSRWNLKTTQEVQFERVVAQVSQTYHFT
ncbi:uncharacterized protein G2W53_040284 [Senna tora]|uniref:Uncharacterized protein n=1 Tax=Senna tora TaxID=362788 RepID=A0A834SRV2_9FABA|nr:uncharacterized protein G2W53_040284 [Senna tora]